MSVWVKWARGAAVVIGPLVAIAEVTRRWGEAGFFPKALDDVLAGLLLVLAALSPYQFRDRYLFGAWAFFAGMMMVAFVTNLDYLLRADAKASLAFTGLLGGLFLFGLIVSIGLRNCSQTGSDSLKN